MISFIFESFNFKPLIIAQTVCGLTSFTDLSIVTIKSFSGEFIFYSGREVTLDGDQGDFIQWRIQDDTTSATFIQSSARFWEAL